VLALRAKGVEVEDAPEIQRREELTGPRIAEVVKRFREHPPVRLRGKSVAKYTESLESFARWTNKTHIGQIGRRDILDFMAHLIREQGLTASTAVDKAVIVKKEMKLEGAKIDMEKGDWPRVTEMQPESYRPEQLRVLFTAMTEEEATRYQLFLQSGFREQEAMFAAWPDLDEQACTLKVSRKLQHGFDPKTYQERTVPIPPALVAKLQKHKLKQPDGTYFILATGTMLKRYGKPGGGPDLQMLRKLKSIAYRAGLNCGQCRTTHKGRSYCCADSATCTKWTLHRFRHTYATELLHDGFDVMTVKELLGHKDIESTMKYVRAMRKEDTAAKIRNSSLARML
jgi:integrase/recombinase XerD